MGAPPEPLPATAAEPRVTVHDQHLSAGQPSPSPSLATQHDRAPWPSDSST